jgi:hypothetical protein
MLGLNLSIERLAHLESRDFHIWQSKDFTIAFALNGKNLAE